jgi:ATP-dependent Clp protease adaptor protein ClpS
VTAETGASASDVEVLPRQEKKLSPPRRFRVLLHDDDFTTMDFVVRILESIFGHDPANATRIMLDVHTKGIGLAGVFAFEVAEAKVNKVLELAQAEGFPFLATSEPEEE